MIDCFFSPLVVVESLIRLYVGDKICEMNLVDMSLLIDYIQVFVVFHLVRFFVEEVGIEYRSERRRCCPRQWCM